MLDLNKRVKSLVIIGAGGLGREVAWLVEDINKVAPEWDLMGFIDDGVKGMTVEGHPILGTVEDLISINEKPWVVVAIADALTRKNIIEKLEQNDFKIATLIHPSVNHSSFVMIGKGSIICCGSTITTNVTLGDACIINPNCFVGHDTIFDGYVSLMPSSNIAGEVHVGIGCYFGLNSCVINRLNIGGWSIIGAGATVVADIPPYSLAVGVPAHVVKKLEA